MKPNSNQEPGRWTLPALGGIAAAALLAMAGHFVIEHDVHWAWWTLLSVCTLALALLAALAHRAGMARAVAARTADLAEANETLRRQRDLFERMAAASPSAVLVSDRAGRITYANPRAAELFGATREALLQRAYDDPAWRITTFAGAPFPPDGLPFRLVQRGGNPVFDVRQAVMRPDGRRVLLSVNAAPVLDAGGQFDGAISVIEDITAAAEAAEAVRLSEARFRELFAHMTSGVAVYRTPDDGHTFLCADINEAGERICRVRRAAVLGREIREAFPGVGPTGLVEALQRVHRSGEPERLPVFHYRDERVEIWAGNRVYRLPNGDLVAVFDDLTEREKAIEEIKNLSRFPAENPNPVLRVAGDGVILYANAGAEPLLRLWGRQSGETVPSEWRARVRRALESRRAEAAETVCEPRVFSILAVPVPDHNYVNLYGRDVTDRVRFEERLHHVNAVLKAVRDVNQLIVREKEPRALIAGACNILTAGAGYAGAWIVLTDETGRPAFTAETRKDGRPAAALEQFHGRLPACLTQAVLRPGAVLVHDVSACRDCPLRERMGEIAWTVTSIDHAGRVYGALALCPAREQALDDEERDLLRELAGDVGFALHGVETEERRRRAETLLAQTQRMESIGRLAGGVAHDFNNILTAIIGYTQYILKDLPADSPHRGDAEQVLMAADRAAQLSRQLLAFGRRQALKPEPTDLNRLIEGVLLMVRRVIGEEIEVRFRPAADLGTARVDAGQIEQVAVNLAVNARDAMPQGGTLTVETANCDLDADYAAAHTGVVPGRFVMFSVTDTGLGMTREVRERIFEPFFTTKPSDQGTGMGLATAYGIVKQHGGNIWVYSEPGMGAAFKVYLPRCDEAPAAPGAPEPAAPPRGTETILLVEDEPAVRDVAQRALEHLGYRVFAAAAPSEALRIFAEHASQIAALVADVVLPEQRGPELYQILCAEKPSLKAMFTSGYAGEAATPGDLLRPGENLLAKPYTLDALARMLRKQLDA